MMLNMLRDAKNFPYSGENVHCVNGLKRSGVVVIESVQKLN